MFIGFDNHNSYRGDKQLFEEILYGWSMVEYPFKLYIYYIHVYITYVILSMYTGNFTVSGMSQGSSAEKNAKFVPKSANS